MSEPDIFARSQVRAAASHVGAGRVRPVVPPAPYVVVASPLVPSRSLGRLLGVESLHFKIETSQPTGSWLDRSAAAIVAAAACEQQTGLGVIGADPWALPLAVQCAQVGLRLVVLEAAGAPLLSAEPGEHGMAGASLSGWLAALGARILAVEADLAAVREAAPAAMLQAGLHFVEPSAPLLGAGLLEVVREIEAAGHGGSLFAVSMLTGQEVHWLADDAAGQRSGAVPLPLDGVAPAAVTRPVAVVGALGWSSERVVDANRPSAPALDSQMVPVVSVTDRDAEAARRLLAREEGLLTSRLGAAGLAGLVRALREDRTRRPRERRLQGVRAMVVTVSGETLGAGEPPPIASDTIPRRPVSLATLSADLARLLVEPPGR